MKTHELKLYASSRHKEAHLGEMVHHLWFNGEHSMQMDLDIALKRDDIAYVDVIDCVNHTTKRVSRQVEPAGGTMTKKSETERLAEARAKAEKDIKSWPGVKTLPQSTLSVKECCDRLLSIATHQFLHDELGQTQYEWIIKALQLVEFVLLRKDSRWIPDGDGKWLEDK